MKLEIHVHVHNADGSESLAILERIYSGLRKGEFKVAESPEMKAFRERMDAATNNVAADIQRLLARSTGLSEEDKAELERIASTLEATASVVTEE